MKWNSVLILAAGFSIGGLAVAEGRDMRPHICYLSATNGIGQVTCTNEKGEPSALEGTSVSMRSTTSEEAPQSLEMTIEGATSATEAYGVYVLNVKESSEQIEVTVQALDEGTGLIIPIRGGRGGGGGYRGGGVHRGGAVAYRGGGVAYRGGGYRYGRGAAVVGGAVVGGAIGAAAAYPYSSGYCDPNYYDCGGGYGGAGVATGAVVGGAVAAGAYRRGAVYRRGGAVAYRGGGARVAHYGARGGGGRRR